MSHADTLAQLRTAIAASPVVDTHDHLRPIGFIQDELRDGVVGLFRNSYLTRSIRVADGSAERARAERSTPRSSMTPGRPCATSSTASA